MPNEIDSPDQGLDRRVGEQIRMIREIRGLSLRSLAALAGISSGLLSQIEKGQSSASVKTLQFIAKSLCVELGDFFAPLKGIPPAAGAVVFRRGQRRCERLSGSEAVVEWVTPPSDGDRLGLHLLHLSPNAIFSCEAIQGGGVQAGYIMAGGIELELPHQSYLLGLHDTFRFLGSRRFQLRNAGGRTAKILWARFQNAPPPPPPPLTEYHEVDH